MSGSCVLVQTPAPHSALYSGGFMKEALVEMVSKHGYRSNVFTIYCFYLPFYNVCVLLYYIYLLSKWKCFAFKVDNSKVISIKRIWRIFYLGHKFISPSEVHKVLWISSQKRRLGSWSNRALIFCIQRVDNGPFQIEQYFVYEMWETKT